MGVDDVDMVDGVDAVDDARSGLMVDGVGMVYLVDRGRWAEPPDVVWDVALLSLTARRYAASVVRI
jgi:hypothetical protein